MLQAGNVPLRNFKSNACLLEEEDGGRKLFSNKPGRKGSLAWEIKEVPVKGEDTGYQRLARLRQSKPGCASWWKPKVIRKCGFFPSLRDFIFEM